ncbi:phospho-glycosyltransferase [Chania multitudinisentens RB-25]|uniref:N-acetylmuramic acid 6-phosphate etherase n=1 Tax=Chania multitudinisentens RB-25 TaxID=1441930 RepID=W0L717_9GAMM|nr:N-acetylmuramic acid 6-phosphate etherase [Chania multitudinisentens]AHG19521.1 phospho-glycosyltransferase [Chania multitudinisentens RB-25]
MDLLSFTISQEQSAETACLSDLPLRDMLALLNEHDARVPQAIRAVLPEVEEAVRLIVAQMCRGGLLFYIGAGTSGRLGVLDSAECPPTFGIDPNLVQAVIAGGVDAMLCAVENVEDDGAAAVAELCRRGLRPEDVVVGIAASGRTPFVIAALDYARKIGAKTIALTTRGPGVISEGADVAIAPDVGAEALSGSTRMKSGSAQKMLLGMLSTAVMTQLGKVHGNFMIDVKASNEKLYRRAEYMVARICGIDEEMACDLLGSVDYIVRAAVLCNRLNLAPEAAREMAAQPFVALKDQLIGGAARDK